MRYIRIHWDTLVYIGIHWDTLKYIGIHWDKLGYIRIHRDIQYTLYALNTFLMHRISCDIRYIMRQQFCLSFKVNHHTQIVESQKIKTYPIWIFVSPLRCKKLSLLLGSLHHNESRKLKFEMSLFFLELNEQI